MATFLKRASSHQARVFRIVEGACRNAAKAHPDLAFDPRLAASIAKRAAGTLVADRDLLRALAGLTTPSERADGTL